MNLTIQISITLLLLTFHQVKSVFVPEAGARNVLECDIFKYQFTLEDLTLTNCGKVQFTLTSYKQYEARKTNKPNRMAFQGLVDELNEKASNNMVIVKIPFTTMNSISGGHPGCGRIWQETFYGKGTFTFQPSIEYLDQMQVVIQLAEQKVFVGAGLRENGKRIEDRIDVFPTGPMTNENQSYVYFGRLMLDNDLKWSIDSKGVDFNEQQTTVDSFPVGGSSMQLSFFTVRLH